MLSTQRLWFAGISAAAILLVSSCASPTVYRAGGPRPHPPGHAYGNKHVHGYDLVYDSACGLYVVIGLTDCYYDDGFFYRVRGGVWEISLRADEWRVITYENLPPRLKVKAGPVAKIDTSRSAKPRTGGPAKAASGPATISSNAGGKPVSLASSAEGKGRAKGHAKGKH